MKKSEIKNKVPYCDITINSNEAKRILIDLCVLSQFKELMPETKILIKYLLELENIKKENVIR